MKKGLSILGFLISIASVTCTRQNLPEYKNPEASVETRVADLLDRMTLEEKIAQLGEASCDGLKEENLAKTTSFSFEKFKNGIGAVDGFTLDVKEYAAAVNKIQNYLVNETRLGIPAIFLTESLHGLVQDGATIYPQSIAMASSWNTDLIWEIACQIRREVRAIGVSQDVVHYQNLSVAVWARSDPDGGNRHGLRDLSTELPGYGLENDREAAGLVKGLRVVD